MRSTHSSHYRALLKRLRQARREAGLTQSQVARSVGRPQSFVSKSESGERRLDPIELFELARLYGKPMAFFLSEGGKEALGGASLAAERGQAFGPRAAARRRPKTRRGS